MKKGKLKETKTKAVENAPEEKISIKGFFISIIVILIVLVGFYFLTVKIMEIRDSKNKKEEETSNKQAVSIRKTNDINYSDLKNMVAPQYFVLFDKKDDEHNSEYDLYINTLSVVDGFQPKFYYIDLSKDENKDLLAEKQSLKSLDNVKVKDTTLIYVENGEISKKYIGSKEIIDFFGKFFKVEEEDSEDSE